MNQSFETFLDVLHGIEDEGQSDMVLNAAKERGKVWQCTLGRTFITLYGIEADGQGRDAAAENWMLEADLVFVFGPEAVQ